MRKILISLIFVVLVTTIGYSDDHLDWQLPISINDTRFDVYQELGIPKEIVKQVDGDPIWHDVQKEKTNEYFYDAGLFVSFWNDIVFRIIIWADCDYPGWNDYLGKIINDITIEDGQREIIDKIGKPTLMKTDPLSTNLDEAADILHYSDSNFLWDYDEYQLEIIIANNNQILDSKKNIIRPAGAVNLIKITAIGYVDEPFFLN